MSRSLRVVAAASWWAVALIPVAAAPVHAEPACDSLSASALPNATVVAVTRVDSGSFLAPRTPAPINGGDRRALRTLPAFCRVQAVAHPSEDSDIRMEVWLPLEHWNGRYVGVGNGSYGGSISYPRLGEALRAGYATSSTNTGHNGEPTDDTWAAGHPEKQTDYDHRAVHETALVAKALVRAFYGIDAAHSYFVSCSNGGRQGLMAAERYPTDYDGVLAGAPALSWGFRTFVSGDLSAFQQRGGKVIIYHGENDSPTPSINFHARVSGRMGDSTTASFLQLYVIPGMRHCGGGAEPYEVGQTIRVGDDAEHSLFKALEEWVERGVAPQGVTAVQFARDAVPSSGVVATRRLYPYPRAPGAVEPVSR